MFQSTPWEIQKSSARAPEYENFDDGDKEWFSTTSTWPYVLVAVFAFVLVMVVGAFPEGSTLAPYVAAAVSTITAYVLEELIKWFINLFGDDPFTPKAVSIATPRGFILPGPDDKLDSTGLTTAMKDLHFYGHGGHYSVRY